MTTPQIRHDAAQSRFVADTEAGEATLEYSRQGRIIAFTHTGVPVEMEGKGVGSALATAGLEYARSEGLHVEPACPFVADFLSKHPEYRSLSAAR